MMFNRFFCSVCIGLIMFLLAGCASTPKDTPQAPAEEAIETTLSAFTHTAEFARGVTEKTGNITEGMIETSTAAIKEIIVSLENLRKKTIETFGQKEITKTEVVGPALIECPYCKKRAKISDPPKSSKEIQYQCPYCKKEFIIKWVD